MSHPTPPTRPSPSSPAPTGPPKLTPVTPSPNERPESGSGSGESLLWPISLSAALFMFGITVGLLLAAGMK